MKLLGRECFVVAVTIDVATGSLVKCFEDPLRGVVDPTDFDGYGYSAPCVRTGFCFQVNVFEYDMLSTMLCSSCVYICILK